MCSQDSESVIAALRSFDGATALKLRRFLFNDKFEKMEKWHKLFEDPVFDHKYHYTNEDQCDRVFAQTKRVADAKMLSIFDFRDDPKNILTAMEMATKINSEITINFIAHYNVFGGSVFGLHTERHLPWMRGIDTLEVTGCFGFTEVGFGNNPMRMETTSTYDAATQEFVIHSPTTLSHKFW